MKDPITTADVVVTIRVSGLGPWSDDASVALVAKVAGEQALMRVGKMIRVNPEVEILGEPKVTLITRMPGGG